jgi:hypothetical protein
MVYQAGKADHSDQFIHAGRHEMEARTMTIVRDSGMQNLAESCAAESGRPEYQNDWL